MNTKINWFEIPSDNLERAVQFYETVFDTKLKMEQFGPSKLGIFSNAAGDSIGAVIKGDGYQTGDTGTIIYLDASPSISKVISRIEAAGGKITLNKLELPNDIGYIAHFIDTEGNRLALHSMA